MIRIKNTPGKLNMPLPACPLLFFFLEGGRGGGDIKCKFKDKTKNNNNEKPIPSFNHRYQVHRSLRYQVKWNL